MNRTTGKSITGLTYIRNHFGPTPAMTFKEVVEGLKKKADAELGSAEKALATAKTDAARTQAEERKQKAAPSHGIKPRSTSADFLPGQNHRGTMHSHHAAPPTEEALHSHHQK